MTNLMYAQGEYFIYSFSGILGTVGGSLGMFLGFSFWQTGGDLIRREWRRQERQKTSRISV